MDKRAKKQKGFIVVVWWMLFLILLIVIVIAVIFLAMLVGGPLRMLTQGEPGAWGQPFGATYASTFGNCKASPEVTISGTIYRLPATSGGVSQEDHLATRAESFNGKPYPSSKDESMTNHLSLTKTPYQRTSGNVWSPRVRQRDGSYTNWGAGNRGTRPTPPEEPWVVNMRWDSGHKQPPEGAKILVSANGKTFVATGAYEYGPGVRESHGNVAGIHDEGLNYLGISHGSGITIGYAVDQNIQGEFGGWGPVNCTEDFITNPNFIRPTQGCISSRFGMRYHPILHRNKMHTGVDIANYNQPVVAVNGGRVVKVVSTSSGGGYGTYVIIDHGNISGRQVFTLYGHLKPQVEVAEGQTVRQGQRLGITDNTGLSTGNHLHFEVRIGNNSAGNAVNPCDYISCGSNC